MRTRTLSIACDPATARDLAEVIASYADAAYPPGGSDCSQVAREALLDVARQCGSHAGATLILRRRMLPQIRAALRWHLSAKEQTHVESRRALLALLATHKESA